MATMVENARELAKLLNSLIELDYDAIAAYRSATEKLADETDKSQLRSFMADHARHVVDLRALVPGLGEKAADSAGMKALLTKGKVVLAGLFGERALLHPMKT